MDNGGELFAPPSAENDSGRLNISDVFEAITLADPTFGAGAGVDDNMARPPHHDEPCVRIIEQPAGKSLRFRYICEGRSAGSIPGVSSTPENKTYPTIKIYGYLGPVIIMVSCITKDEPYRTHPHNLVGRVEQCDKGVCTIPTCITEETREYQFKNLGIQCVKKRDIEKALLIREEMRIDPFRQGFGHKNHPQSIDLNAVRLCFQVFVPDGTGKIRRPLPCAVSDVIYDKKAMSDLQIVRASHCSGTVRGGMQVILLCEKVNREDTAVVFYQEENSQVVWEESATIVQVHKQAAIAFQTPPYRNPHTSEHVVVHFQLKRLTDNARSNSLPFEYIPEYPDRIKRRKVVNSMLQEHERLYQQEQKPIKSEPRDKTSPHHMSSPPQVFSPQYSEQNWGVDNMGQGGPAIPGPSHTHNPFARDMAWVPTYQAGSPNMQPVSPNIRQMTQNLHVMSPNMQNMSPNMQTMTPNLHVMSPNMQAMSPNMQPMSPNMQAMSPNMQAMSPNMQMMASNVQGMSPNVQVLSPSCQNMTQNMQILSPNPMAMAANVGRISPNMGAQHTMGPMASNMQQQPDFNQQMPQQNVLEQNSSSFSNLLMDQEDGIIFNSSELSSISSMLGRTAADMSDTMIL